MKVSKLIKRIENHVQGGECECAAYSESECGCLADWRTRQEMAAVTALEFCLSILKSHHVQKPGIAETIRQTEAIRDAGKYRYPAT